MPETILQVDVGDSREEAFEVHVHPDNEDRHTEFTLSAEEAEGLGKSFIEDLCEPTAIKH